MQLNTGVLECAQYSPTKDKFQSLFENVILGSLKSFFQLDHQVNISLYLKKALHSATLGNSLVWQYPWSAFNSITLLASRILKPIASHFISRNFEMPKCHAKST